MHLDIPDEDDAEEQAEYHALELGAGRSVVLLHDLYASQESFAAVTDALAEDWRVIGLDLPGHGRTNRPGDFADLTDLALEVAAVLDEFGAFPAAIVGTGVGATVAVEIAAERPEEVTALVLVGAGLGAESVLWGHPATDAWLGGSGAPADLADALMPLLHGERFFAEQPGRAAAERERLEALERTGIAQVAAVAAAAGDRLGRLAAVRAPTLILAGDADAVVTRRRSEEVAGAAHTDLVLVPFAGHSPVLERPREVTEAIREFLRER